MPTRRERSRSKRINDNIIDELREMVLAGIPWQHVPQFERTRGRSDLILLVYGAVYLLDYIHGRDDTDTMADLWFELRDVVIQKHIEFAPGSRPWAFYALEDRE